MKKFHGAWILILGLILNSCDQGNGIETTEAPRVDFANITNPFQEDSLVHAAPGERLRLEAWLRDEVGIQRFHLYYPLWDLDNTIEVAEYYPDRVLYEYLLSFGFEVPPDTDPDEEYILMLTVTNRGGLTTEREVYVAMDGDYQSPVISEVSPGNNEIVEGDAVNIKFRVQENEELKYVVFHFPAMEIYDSVTSFRGGKAYAYDQVFDGLTEGKYRFTIRARDMYENSREKEVNFLISQ